jgi:hypothetical protein
MTDKEIIKALECCISAESCCVCGYTKMCDGTTIHQFALDPINRQQAEIEKLERTILYLEGVCESTPDKVRAEAIKEFAERLKANKGKLFNYIFSSNGFDKQIDNLVKEMVGDDK